MFKHLSLEIKIHVVLKVKLVFIWITKCIKFQQASNIKKIKEYAFATALEANL